MTKMFFSHVVVWFSRKCGSGKNFQRFLEKKNRKEKNPNLPNEVWQEFSFLLLTTSLHLPAIRCSRNRQADRRENSTPPEIATSSLHWPRSLFFSLSICLYKCIFLRMLTSYSLSLWVSAFWVLVITIILVAWIWKWVCWFFFWYYEILPFSCMIFHRFIWFWLLCKLYA